jgi:hypothetical protein
MNALIIAVGAGRDGTTTLTRLINDIFHYNDHPETALHQRDHALLYNELAKLLETGNAVHRDNMLKAISRWQPGEAIVGNGYAHCLPSIHDVHGSGTKLVHLMRAKDPWLRSFIENIETFPRSHGNYSDHSSPKIERVAAFHYGEMTREEWNALSLEDKASWYYDATHSLAEKHAALFDDVLVIKTEALSSDKTISNLTAFIDASWKPPDVTRRLNASLLNYADLPLEQRVVVNRFYQEFDHTRAATHPCEGEAYFAGRVLDGFMNRKTYEHSAVSRDEIEAYERVLSARLTQIRELLSRSED